MFFFGGVGVFPLSLCKKKGNLVQRSIGVNKWRPKQSQVVVELGNQVSSLMKDKKHQQCGLTEVTR